MSDAFDDALDGPYPTQEELKQARLKADADTEALLIAIRNKAAEFRALLWSARSIPDGWSSDGSFGLNMADKKVDEAEMWANKEIRSRHGVVWP
jgi:hypothetical protein